MQTPDLFDPNKPRLGRRESEPHSNEINYIYDVLSTNFPESRTIRDLHHYFIGKQGSLKRQNVGIQFDISFFKDFSIPYTLSSYDASKFEGRVPEMGINILSKSTWRADLSENVDKCKNLEIQIYVIYSSYKVTSKVYHPPFLRAYILNEKGVYEQEELENITLKEGGVINGENVIDVSDKLPFRLGLMQLKRKHEGEQPLYRLVFIHPSEPEIYLSKSEIAQQKLEITQKEKEKVLKELEEYKKRFGEID